MRQLLFIVLTATVASCSTHHAVEEARPLRVLVYNIHAGKDAGGVDNLERVAGVIERTRAEVVLLQEVDSATRRSGGVDQLAALARRTGMTGVYGSTIEWQGGSFGLAILSRHPVVAHRFIPLATDPPQPRAGFSREPRGILVATLAAPLGSLVVMNTHLDATGDATWRRQQVAQVIAVADSLRAGGALLVGGDLNARPDTDEIRALASAGLTDAWLRCGEGAGFTFPAGRPDRRIDYLFLSSRLRCIGARVLGDLASDHRALLVEVAPQ